MRGGTGAQQKFTTENVSLLALNGAYGGGGIGVRVADEITCCSIFSLINLPVTLKHIYTMYIHRQFCHEK